MFNKPETSKYNFTMSVKDYYISDVILILFNGEESGYNSHFKNHLKFINDLPSCTEIIDDIMKVLSCHLSIDDFREAFNELLLLSMEWRLKNIFSSLIVHPKKDILHEVIIEIGDKAYNLFLLTACESNDTFMIESILNELEKPENDYKEMIFYSITYSIEQREYKAFEFLLKKYKQCCGGNDYSEGYKCFISLIVLFNFDEELFQIFVNSLDDSEKAIYISEAINIAVEHELDELQSTIKEISQNSLDGLQLNGLSLDQNFS